RWAVYDFDGTLRTNLSSGTAADPGQPSISLPHPGQADSGTYVVIATDAQGNVVEVRSFNVVVGSAGGDAPVVSTNGYAAQFRRGGQAALSVDVISATPIRVDWHKNGVLFAENAGVWLSLGEM